MRQFLVIFKLDFQGIKWASLFDFFRQSVEVSYPDMSVFFIFLFLIPLACSLGFPKAFKAGGLQIDLQYLE